MIQEISAWKCDKCERVYFDRPASCTCTKEITDGNVVGCFRIISKSNGRKFSATCLLCGLDTEIDTSNIRRQKSCGCKPKYCDVLSNTDAEVRYRCKRCGKILVSELPIMVWCCEIGEGE